MLPVELAESSRQHLARDPGDLDQPNTTPLVEPVETRHVDSRPVRLTGCHNLGATGRLT